MAVKRQSSRTELGAIYNLCEARKELQTELFNKLSEDLFDHAPARNAFRRIRALHTSKGTIPSWESLLVDTALSQDERRIINGFEVKKKVSNEQDVTSLVEALDNYRVIRVQADLAETIAEAFTKDKEFDPNQFTNVIKDKVDKMGKRFVGLPKPPMRIGAGGDSYKEVMSRIYSGEARRNLVPTGFPLWDKTNGGFPKGEVVMISGTTGGGKSLIGSVQLLKNMATHRPALLVALEMDEIGIMSRLMANVSGIPVNQITMGLTDNEQAHIDAMVDEWHEEMLKNGSYYDVYCPPTRPSMRDLLASIDPSKYEVVLIDYIGLLDGLSGDDQWRAMKTAAEDAKVWAQQNNVCVILLAQLDSGGNLKYSKGMLDPVALSWSFVTDRNRPPQSEGLPDDTTYSGLPIAMHKCRQMAPIPNYELDVDWATMRVTEAGGLVERSELLPGNKKKKVLMESEDEDDLEVARPAKTPKSKTRAILDDDEDTSVLSNKTSKTSPLQSMLSGISDMDDDEELVLVKPKPKPKSVDKTFEDMPNDLYPSMESGMRVKAKLEDGTIHIGEIVRVHSKWIEIETKENDTLRLRNRENFKIKQV